MTPHPHIVSRACNRGARVTAWRALARAGVCMLLVCQCSTLDPARPAQLVTYGRFRAVRLYRARGPATHLALLLSGDGGWSRKLGSIAAALTATGTLVAGIDVRALLADYRRDPGGCLSPGADLAGLARFLAQRYALPAAAPILVGHSAGATLVYVALAQAPPGTFAGALTLSFCADLDLEPPLCPAPALASVPRHGGVRLVPAGALPAPWIAVHGLDDQVCPVARARTFVAGTPGAAFVGVAGVNHLYHDTQRWWPQFAAAFARLANSASPAVALPARGPRAGAATPLEMAGATLRAAQGAG